jgi:hypothetical protein
MFEKNQIKTPLPFTGKGIFIDLEQFHFQKISMVSTRRSIQKLVVAFTNLQHTLTT